MANFRNGGYYYIMKKTTRHGIRDSAFKILFQKSWIDDSLAEIYSLIEEEQLEDFVLNDDTKIIVNGVIENQNALDEVISKYSKSRDIDRIAVVNLIILRIAIYEILFDDKTPVNSAISEAVKLAQMYSAPKDISFVNGLLGAYAKDLNKDSE